MLKRFPLKLVRGKLCIPFSFKQSLINVMKGPWHPDLASPLKENALHDVLINRSTPDSDFL